MDEAGVFSAHSQSTLDQALAIKQRGNELYKQQKFDEAIKCYEQAIQVCPPARKSDIAVFHQNLAAVYDAMVGPVRRDGVWGGGGSCVLWWRCLVNSIVVCKHFLVPNFSFTSLSLGGKD